MMRKETDWYEEPLEQVEMSKEDMDGYDDWLYEQQQEDRYGY